MSRGRAGAPAALRLAHALVFLGFGSGTVASGHLELLQAWRALTHPWHSGTAPNALAVTTALSAIGLSLALLWLLARGRTVPLGLSVAMLVAFGGSLAATSFVPTQRTVPGANLVALEQARALHGQLNAALQSSSRVPRPFEGDAWKVSGQSPFADRTFARAPWRLRAIQTDTELPTSLEPGTILVWVSDDAVSFALVTVGIDGDGAAVRLIDEQGEPVTYRGTFNPDAHR